LRAARAAGADTLAPLTLRWARDAYAAGLYEARRQKLRVALLRDHREAEASLDSAIALAERAVTIAERHRLRVEREVEAVLKTTRAAVAPLRGVEDVVWLTPPDRRKLQEARRLLAGAASLIERGASAVGVDAARESTRLAEEVGSAILAATSRFSAPEGLERWAKWADETVAWSARTGRSAIVVLKDEHRLTLYEAGRPVLTFHADLGWNNVGDKRRQGDGATPEGRYFITEKKGPGRSRYHRALVLDYPNAEDLRTLAELRRSGRLEPGTRPGGLVELHGEGGLGRDWTDGCVAVTNNEIDEIFGRVALGTPVTVVGSRSGNGVFSQVARRLRP
jgi:hypothetical protein